MRGTPLWRVPHGVSVGIIPAYAGNTTAAKTKWDKARDHPRVCGEHKRAWSSTNVLTGSSPRMRGTPCCNQILKAYVGIIPAYAGNTCCLIRPPWMRRDHPRVCGEHYTKSPPTSSGLGSSPRMRGTRVRHVGGDISSGIIPAYAGNTIGSVGFPIVAWDHPRVCGEHLMCAILSM